MRLQQQQQQQQPRQQPLPPPPPQPQHRSARLSAGEPPNEASAREAAKGSAATASVVASVPRDVSRPRAVVNACQSVRSIEVNCCRGHILDREEIDRRIDRQTDR